jgi:hypothetical protein
LHCGGPRTLSSLPNPFRQKRNESHVQWGSDAKVDATTPYLYQFTVKCGDRSAEYRVAAHGRRQDFVAIDAGCFLMNAWVDACRALKGGGEAKRATDSKRVNSRVGDIVTFETEQHGPTPLRFALKRESYPTQKAPIFNEVMYKKRADDSKAAREKRKRGDSGPEASGSDAVVSL